MGVMIILCPIVDTLWSKAMTFLPTDDTASGTPGGVQLLAQRHFDMVTRAGG